MRARGTTDRRAATSGTSTSDAADVAGAQLRERLVRAARAGTSRPPSAPGRCGASASNSSPSRRVRFATERSVALAPEDLVRERRDVGHVDAGADDGAALRDGRERRRDELAGRGEDDRRVELLGRRARAGPLRAERAGERLRLVVALARHGEHAAALAPRDLRDDVRRGAEAVQAEPLGVAGEAQRAVADQPGAEERRRLEVAEARRGAGSRSARRRRPTPRSRRRGRSR